MMRLLTFAARIFDASKIARAACCLSCLAVACSVQAQITRPDDAPRPLAAEKSSQRFHVPDGFQVELVASEPLIREPSGVCWDERGQLFVCELHGYNLEGQYDVEELNKTGKLDRVVRRIQADERHKQAAAAETYGTIRRLIDSDGDGKVDRAEVWADRLPPCLGICAAREGIIAACQTQILFLADRDGNGQAELREVLFEGFQPGPLERSINCPQYGPDDWIYVGRGAGGGTIRGKYLTEPVELPSTDFRIKADGTAIEPVVGGTATMGFAFTESGDRFTISTRTPGIFVAPFEWRYLARNPDVAASSLDAVATTDQRVYPTSKPHPWRTQRATDPGFSKYYSDRYGFQESEPNGYFTSACSPLVYQDSALPGLRGQLFACEPAQNLIHRAIITRDGSRLLLSRPESEAQSEFLTSSDPWFHAIALSHAPDGSIYIADFYREIIEDYSAIPRYLQQLYGLIAGRDHGRVWKLTHKAKQDTPDADMSRLSVEQLAAEVVSPHYWRRTTARRLLVERKPVGAAPQLARAARNSAEAFAVINSLQTLDGLGELASGDVAAALQHADPSVRRQALRFAERWFDTYPELLEKSLKSASDSEAMVRLQAALSLGQSRNSVALEALARLAQEHGSEPWMTLAILTSVPGRGAELLAKLLTNADSLGQAESLLEPLCNMIANRRDGAELSQALAMIASLKDPQLQASCLRGVRSSFRSPASVQLSDEARAQVRKLAHSSFELVRGEATVLVKVLSLESPVERRARLDLAFQQLNDVQQPLELRLAAVAQLADESEAAATDALLNALSSSTPVFRDAILAAIFSHKDRLPRLLSAIEAKTVPAAVLSGVQRATLLEANEPEIRRRAAALLNAPSAATGQMLAGYLEALKQPRDVARGQQVFRDRCATCHQAHGIGHAVGPDLSAEFQRAEETIIRDVVAPSDTISAGYVTYTIATTSGQVLSGLLSSETPTSLSLRQSEGKEETILRKDVEQLRAMSVSMMPEDLTKTVSPRDLADVLAWLRRPPTNLVLLDEDRELATALREGNGTAAFVTTDKHSGAVSLQVTPPQRYAARIEGWQFRIRERPAPGEYRYLRFAWKTPQASGAMLELADNGQWPGADQKMRRYHAGSNTTKWHSMEVAPSPPREWTVVTRDLWQDCGDFTLTGIAPTAMGAAVLFDRIELLQSVEPLAGAIQPTSTKAPAGVTAVSSQPAHPILVRNEHGALTRVAIKVARSTTAKITELTFDLDGTDDLNDIGSLSLFATGEKETFSPARALGEPQRAASSVTFRIDEPLGEGRNYFWLSCRLNDTADLLHRVAARCTAIETSAGTVAPNNTSPGASHRIGIALRRHNDDGVHTYRIPALTTTRKGTLLCVYDMRRRTGRDLQEDIDIGLSRSTDGGRTWQPVRVIMDMGEFGGLPQEQNGCSDPGIIVDQQTGEIFCFALWMHGKPGKHQWVDDGSEPGFEIGKSAQFMMVRSKDDGLTWTEPQNLTRELKQESWWLLAPSPQAGINLPDGTLVMPAQGRTGRAKGETFATIMTSRDHGLTWKVAEPGYRGGNECQAALLGDGSIMLNVRNDRERFRAVAVTGDLGQTWAAHPTSRNTLIEPNCNGSLLRVDYEATGRQKHALLFANPHSQAGRTHHTIQVSFDDGQSWPESHHVLLDEGRGAGYPSLTVIDRDHIGIVYEGSQAQLVFEKFALSELLRPATPR